MGDGETFALLDLEDGLVVIDEETALGDMAFKRRKRGRGRQQFFYGR